MRALLAAALLAALAVHAEKEPEVRTGIDVLAAGDYFELKGKKVGLISNQTGRDRRGVLTAELLASATGVELVRIFSPEHGFLGASEENKVSSDTYRAKVSSGPLRDIPIVSLYAGGIAGMRPKQDDLKGLDAVVFDIQDIGARFYTYLATMGMALEETAKAGIPFIILDRPNPLNGLTMEGPVLEDLALRQVTSTAYFPVPIRHGMTAGEIALLHNDEVKHPGLKIIRMKGWRRELWGDQTGLPWVPTSPNMPDLGAAYLYPGIGCFEASNIAVGRGTPVPFRWIGAPWMDADAIVKKLNAKGRVPGLEGVKFTVETHTPTKSVFAGVPCRGIRINVDYHREVLPVRVFLHLATALRDRHPGQFQWRWDEAKRMIGTDGWRKLYEAGVSAEEMIKVFDRGPRAFETARKPFLLY